MQPIKLDQVRSLMHKIDSIKVIVNDVDATNVVTWIKEINIYGLTLFKVKGKRGKVMYGITIFDSVQGVTLNYLGTAQVLINDTWFYIERGILEYND